MTNEYAQLLEAVFFAAEKHCNQRRKNEEASPYINHPIQVAKILATIGGVTDINVLCAAVLHDTIEDTKTTGPELEARFGAEVRGLVEEVTDDKSLPKEVRKKLQVEHASSLSKSAKLIKLGDKISNAGDVTENPPKDWPFQRRVDYLTWTELVVARLRGTNAALEKCFDDTIARGRLALGERS